MSRVRAPHKIGIALAGGGFLGAIYELGSLCALAEGIDGLDLKALDVYVGVSAGAFICAGLANGFSPHQMVRRFVESEDTNIPIDPATLMNPAWDEWRAALSKLPNVSRKIINEAFNRPFNRPITGPINGTNSRPTDPPNTSWKALLWQAIERGSELLPRGLMDSSATQAKFAQLFAEAGRTDDFRKLSSILRIVATDLDSGESVEFGSKGFDAVPISTAIRASSAVPGLFAPVQINDRHYVDGALNKTLHASVALDAGARLVFCLNPLVPWDNTIGKDASNGMGQGLADILSQTVRTVVRSRMSVGLARYKVTHPKTDILLFEPQRDDPIIFKSRIFSFQARRALCEHVYQQTRRNLLERQSELKPILARHGLKLNITKLADQRTTLVRPQPRPKHAKPASLSAALQQLSFVLEDLDRHVRLS